MAISDDDYLSWLQADGKSRVVLVEADAWSGGALVARYMSNRGFISEPSDAPANVCYDGIVTSVPEFTEQMSEQFVGQSTPSWGDIEISNENGDRDSWLDDGWDGRSVRIYLGDATWAKADFRKILDGSIADIYAKDPRTLALKIRGKEWMLNVAAQTNLLGAGTANAGQPIPLSFGPCFNVEPVLTNAATHEYQVHDGQINDVVNVYDNGVAVGYVKDLAHGKFTLTAAPAGRITADVQGAAPGGTYLTKCADIVEHLITTRTQLTGADLDAASFAAYNVTCPQTLNRYVKDRENLIPIIDELVTSGGGWWCFSRDGSLQLGRLEAPAGAAALELGKDDLVESTLGCVRHDIPTTVYRLGYRRNWTVMTDGIAGAATEARRADLAAEYLVSTASDASVLTAHPLALTPDLEGTLLALQADADAEVARLQALWGVARSVFRADAFATPSRIQLGQVVKLTHPRFGFDAGALAVVVRIVGQHTKGRVTLDLWK